MWEVARSADRAELIFKISDGRFLVALVVVGVVADGLKERKKERCYLKY